MKKILVAMSGGVDSTVVAYHLKKEGFPIEGVYMILHDNPTYHQENIRKVKIVSDFLGIKYHILDLSKNFQKKIIDYFIDEYKSGLTPNPCVVCNKEIKLGELVEFARQKGFDSLATGHYANIENGFIAEAKDLSKDQSYFLSNVKREILDFVIFPLGGRLKEDIVNEAKEIDILNQIASQKESSEICFVEDSYIDILKEKFDTDIEGKVFKNGEEVGVHKGYTHYTIGKRRGFSVKGALTPNYVLSIDAKNNSIIVGEKEQLRVDSFIIKDINIFIEKKEFEAEVKIRYRSPKTKCRVQIQNNIALVQLQTPTYGLAPGQTAVFYEKNRVIGCGWIVDKL